jgi:signal transduction histidine kinase/DNA-binding response OmpR family regulator/ligand-binding sensor domain-containing protein
MFLRLQNYLLALILSAPFLLIGQKISRLGPYEGIGNGAVRTFAKDSMGYMWIGTSMGLNKFSGSSLKSYKVPEQNEGIVDLHSGLNGLFALESSGNILQYDYEKDQLIKLKNVSNIPALSFDFIDEERLIIGLQQGLILFNIKSLELSKIINSKSLFNRKVIVEDGKVYVASTNGIDVYDLNKVESVLIYEKTLLNDIEVLDIAFDHNKRLWAGTNQKGLHILEEGHFKKISLLKNKDNLQTIRSITFDNDNSAIIAIEGDGLIIFNEDLELIKKISHDPNNKNSLQQNSIYEIYVDETNVYWLGLRELGVDLVYPYDNPFVHINYVPFSNNSISNNYIRSIYFDNEKRVWFGTENGISALLPSGQWVNYNSNPLFANRAILTIDEYNSKLLLSVYGVGLVVFDPETGIVNEIRLKENQKKSKMIFTTLLDGDELWTGGFDSPVKHFKNSVLVKNYITGNARTIVKGPNNKIYVGSPNGFFEINKISQSINRIDQNKLGDLNQLHSLLYDKKNSCIWIGNNRGLLQFDIESQNTISIQKSGDYELGTIYSIQKDSRENLWLTTYNGLWKYNTISEKFLKYTVDDGLSIYTFGFGASAKAENGTLAFGGPSGAVIFDEKKLPEEQEIYRLYISNFQINGLNANEVIKQKNINFLNEISLKNHQNSLSFNFEVPTFHGSKEHIYHWQLIGYENTPNTSQNGKKIIYPKLSYGQYILKAYATNKAGTSLTNQLEIHILVDKPFWLSNWAIIGYFFSILFLAIVLIGINKIKISQRFNEDKIKFFTEVAHDIRTPVSLIKLLATNLATKNPELRSDIKLIKKNSQNLNEYVTQLLDFQKAERNQLKLLVSKIDIKDLIRKVIFQVQPLVDQKSIDVIISVPKTTLWLDKEKITRIFNNLISNAIKYSPEGGQIKIKAKSESNQIIIDFIDYGFGIPSKDQKLIFSRFTRGTNINDKQISGSGLGLMISKKIIELHGGKIELNSKENLGSTFSVILKKGSKHYRDEDILVEVDKKNELIYLNNNENFKKLILLVDDNDDLRSSLKKQLEELNFKVIESKNGKEGLVIALSKNPDLIITDVMMPLMDGKEFCKVIKSNFETSHIPVIMITALGDISNKVEGIKIGADAYLEKPFNVKVLNAYVHNLLNTREILKKITSDKTNEKFNSPDEKLISDLIKIVHQNMTNYNFSVELLAKKIGLSRSNLFRKVKGLTGLSPNEFITQIKMNHAAELLNNNKGMRISNVAFESGFNDSRYFSTIFKKFFGKSPKDYSKQV